jgi:hypothetical protein
MLHLGFYGLILCFFLIVWLLLKKKKKMSVMINELCTNREISVEEKLLGEQT